MEHILRCYLCNIKCDDSISLGKTKIAMQLLHEVIDLHFWFKLDVSTDGFLCSACFRQVRKFHEFYLNIRKVHCDPKRDKNIKFRIHLAMDKVMPPKDFENTNENNNLGNCSEDNIYSIVIEDSDEVMVEMLEIKIDDSVESSQVATVRKDPLQISEEVKYNPRVRTEQQCCATIPNDVDGNDNPLPGSHAIEMISKILKYKCSQCSERFHMRTSLDEHVKAIHCSKICGICGLFYETFELYMHHYALNHSNPKVLCGICDKWLENDDILTEHRKSDHKNMKLPSKCKYCGKRFLSRGQTRFHEANVHEKVHRSFQCEVCGKKLRKPEVLKMHMVVHNGYTNWHHCPICSKTFRYYKSICKHLELHH